MQKSIPLPERKDERRHWGLFSDFPSCVCLSSQGPLPSVLLIHSSRSLWDPLGAPVCPISPSGCLYLQGLSISASPPRSPPPARGAEQREDPALPPLAQPLWRLPFLLGWEESVEPGGGGPVHSWPGSSGRRASAGFPLGSQSLGREPVFPPGDRSTATEVCGKAERLPAGPHLCPCGAPCSSSTRLCHPDVAFDTVEKLLGSVSHSWAPVSHWSSGK